MAMHSTGMQITYPGSGNYSQFSYDPEDRNTKIVEFSGGTASSTKQFVWCFSDRCECRNGTGALLNEFFRRGQQSFSGGTGTSYFYNLDHLSSVREVTESSGVIVGEQAFDPYGRFTAVVASLVPEFGYAGYYFHSRSGLSFTQTRVYSATLARFLSQDPSGELSGGGINLYGYANSNPVNFRDPRGSNAVAGAIGGAEMGSFAGPVGTVVGGVAGAIAGAIAAGLTGKALADLVNQMTADDNSGSGAGSSGGTGSTGSGTGADDGGQPDPDPNKRKGRKCSRRRSSNRPGPEEPELQRAVGEAEKSQGRPLSSDEISNLRGIQASHGTEIMNNWVNSVYGTSL